MSAAFRVSRTPALALLVIVAVAAGAWYLWPSEERQIRRRHAELAKVFNERPADGFGLVARAAQLSRFFTDDVVVEPGRGAGPIVGRERLLALAARAPNSGDGYRLDFVDISVDVSGETAASAMTATLASHNSETGQREVDAHEVALEWLRSDEWRIARIRLVETLERP
jgi:hypothetical protein